MLTLWNTLSPRWLNLAGAVAVAGLFGFGLYLQYVLRLEPCPLCMLQRVIFIAIGALFFIAALHNAGRFGSRIYAVLIAAFALGGVAAAVRHIWLQHLPKDQVPACGPGLDYMLQNFPLAEVWQELLHGSGECAEKGWTFLALGIPEWSLVWYVLLGVFAVLVGWKKN
ncbi:MAG: disulfide bond formation protein B [Gammaproteobacteria bacterium]|nr:disulfide bond formation protein B [Gammaproteobacteria bacterium]MBU1777744.1 disulfide bond formation protein B [Gammaproteobacteria bacterium]MBU1969705.1 disulfide bond formation protein B [Gammaproteobacteria bacterium]